MSTVNLAVIIKLIDELSGPAKRVATSMRQILNLGKQFKTLGGSKNALGAQFNVASASAKKLNADMRALGSQMKGVAASGRVIAQSVAGSGAAAGIRAQATSWTRVAVAQAKVIANNAKINAGGGGRMGAGGGGFGGGFGHHGMGMGMYGGAYMGMYAAGRVGHGIASGMQKGGNLQNEMTLLQNLGLPQDQIAAIVKEARAASAAVPQVSMTDTLHSFREMRYAFADTQHAVDSMQMMNKFMVTMSAVMGDGKMSEIKDQVYSAAKSAEMTGHITDKATLQGWLDTMQQQAESSGGIVDPQKTFQAIKYARGAAQGYNDEFLKYYLPEYVQEMSSGGRKGGGSRGGAGTALAAFKRMFVDQKFTQGNVPALITAGLIDPKKAHKTRNGWKLDEHAFHNQETAAANPFQFIKENIIPALEKSGIDPADPANKAKVVAKLGQWFSTQLAQQLAQLTTMFTSQMERRAKMTGMSAKVQDSIDRLMKNYNQSLKGMKEQFDSMTAFVTLPFLPSTSGVLRSITGAETGIREYFANHTAGIEKLAPVLMASAGGLLFLAVKAIAKRFGLLPMLLGGGAGLLSGDANTGLMAGLLLGGVGRGAAKIGGAAAGAAAGGGFMRSMIAAVSASKGGLYAAVVALLAGMKYDSSHGNVARTWLRELLGLEDDKEPAPWMSNGSFDPWRQKKDAIPFTGADKAPWKIPAWHEDKTSGGPYPIHPGGIDPQAMNGLNPPNPSLLSPPLLNKITGAKEAADAWLQEAMSIVSLLSGKTVQGPSISAPSVPGGGGGGSPSRGVGHASLGGGGAHTEPALYRPQGGGAHTQQANNVTVHAIHLNVHGAGDPNLVAAAVHKVLAQSYRDALSDGQAA